MNENIKKANAVTEEFIREKTAMLQALACRPDTTLAEINKIGGALEAAVEINQKMIRAFREETDA